MYASPFRCHLGDAKVLKGIKQYKRPNSPQHEMEPGEI